jgi:hypothetical protein
MSEDTGKALTIVALLVSGALGAYTALRCRQAAKHGVPAGDALVWAVIAAAYLGLSQTKLARVLGVLKTLGQWLRTFAREHQVYANRRPFQIAASVIVATVAVALFVYGVVSYWDQIKRYRLAVGFAALAVGFATIRFISLHEVDAWNAQLPWLRVAVELTASAGAAAVAVVRLRQLRALDRSGSPSAPGASLPADR